METTTTQREKGKQSKEDTYEVYFCNSKREADMVCCVVNFKFN